MKLEQLSESDRKQLLDEYRGRMTEKEKTQYIRSALGLSGVAVNDHMAEMIWRMYESLQELGGSFSLRDAANIEAFMNKKFNIKQERREDDQQQVLDEMKAKSMPKHDSVLSVMLAYLDKYWSNTTGRPSAEDVIKKRKINNRDMSLSNCLNAITAMKQRYKGNQNWSTEPHNVTEFLENELSATEQETTEQPQA